MIIIKKVINAFPNWRMKTIQIDASKSAQYNVN